MIRIISLVMVFIMVFSFNLVVSADGYLEGKEKGKVDAKDEHSSVGYWLAGGVGSFFLSPLLGGGVTITTSYIQEPEPDDEIVYSLRQKHSQEFINGYKRGYIEKAKSKNVRASWASTGIAFLGRLLIIGSADTKSSDGYSTYSMETETANQLNTVPVMSFDF